MVSYTRTSALQRASIDLLAVISTTKHTCSQTNCMQSQVCKSKARSWQWAFARSTEEAMHSFHECSVLGEWKAYGQVCSWVEHIHAGVGQPVHPPSAGQQTSQGLLLAAAHTGPLCSQSAALHLETAGNPTQQDTCKASHDYDAPAAVTIHCMCQCVAA